MFFAFLERKDLNSPRGASWQFVTLPPYGDIWSNMFFPLKPILQVRPIVGKLLNALSTPSQQVSPFTTLETRREPESKWVPQLFLGSLLVTRRSAIEQCFSLSFVTDPEAFAKVNSAQFPTPGESCTSSEVKQRRRRRQRERQKQKKRVRLAKQQLCTSITLFCTFLCRCCTTTTWKCLIWRFVEDVNTRQRLSFSFPELWYSLLEFKSRKKYQHLTNWTSWNNCDKVWSSATSLFKWRFRSRRCRCRLSSLLLNSLSLHRLDCLSDYTS